MPVKDCGVIHAHLALQERVLVAQENPKLKIPLSRGLGALIGAATYTLKGLSPNSSYVELETLLVGDLGSGAGSCKLYAHLIKLLPSLSGLSGLTFHYLYPEVDWHNRILLALEELEPKPLLVADAGFMYAAKMSGYADHYDLFTPDQGELAFLADAEAPHPFYTRGFFLNTDRQTSELVKMAYEEGNAAKWLIIKGSVDNIICAGELKGQIDSPNVPAMEAIGGTGDLVTGVVTGLLAQGLSLDSACLLAAKASRLAGFMAQPTPATQIEEILPFLPAALNQLLN
ncbi:MAG: sugar kinase [Desulfovibrionaceae bacterium]|nr:sugar kinase [Desulfovibrionaceae bacterium]